MTDVMKINLADATGKVYADRNLSVARSCLLQYDGDKVVGVCIVAAVALAVGITEREIKALILNSFDDELEATDRLSQDIDDRLGYSLMEVNAGDHFTFTAYLSELNDDLAYLENLLAAIAEHQARVMKEG